MLTYDDCLPLTRLNDEERKALVRNPVMPDEIILKLGHYMVLSAEGQPAMRQTLLKDLHTYHADRDFYQAAKLRLIVKVFVDNHPSRGLSDHSQNGPAAEKGRITQGSDSVDKGTYGTIWS